MHRFPEDHTAAVAGMPSRDRSRPCLSLIAWVERRFWPGEAVRATWEALDRRLEPGRTVCSRPGSVEAC
jgi:hypothetical protein